MDQENIMFFKNQNESYTMIDLYLYERFFEDIDSYNYYGIDFDKVLLFKKVMVDILLDIMMYIIQKLYHYD